MSKQSVEVSVFLVAYNHEKYVRKCLENAVNQKVNFKYEIIIHDDASTDGTKKIIQEFVEKYPDLIVPIYQSENQFSKGKLIIQDIMLPISRGKYIAMCECDDYWCDENKLQLQYDFMEAHPDCAACFHNSFYYDLLQDKIIKKFNSWEEVHKMTPEDCIKLGAVHLSSYFMKKEFCELNEYSEYSFGDYVRLTQLLEKGDLYTLPQVMSVYNFNNVDGLTYKVDKTYSRLKKLAEKNKVNEYLKRFDEQTKNKYHDIIYKEVSLREIAIMNERFYEVQDKTQLKEFQKEFLAHSYYKTYCKQLGLFSRIKLFIKLHSPFWLWKLLIKKQ